MPSCFPVARQRSGRRSHHLIHCGEELVVVKWLNE